MRGRLWRNTRFEDSLSQALLVQLRDRHESSRWSHVLPLVLPNCLVALECLPLVFQPQRRTERAPRKVWVSIDAFLPLRQGAGESSGNRTECRDCNAARGKIGD